MIDRETILNEFLYNGRKTEQKPLLYEPLKIPLNILLKGCIE